MYCDKCGADNSETAAFCRRCGVAIDHEVETRVATRPEPDHGKLFMESTATDNTVEDEKELFSISPTLLFVKSGYALAAVGALLFVALFSILFTSVTAWVWVLLGLCLFLIPAFYHVRQRLVRYTLTDTKVEIDRGLIARSTQNIPIRRIQDVTVTTSMAQRLLGFGDLVIDNASEQGGKIILKNINTPQKYADILLRQMRLLDK